jgi:hypothetical protein
MAMMDKVPDAVKDTYLKMKGEHGKKLELKVIGGSYYLIGSVTLRRLLNSLRT